MSCQVCCTRAVFAKGMCRRCYYIKWNALREANPALPRCEVSGCDRVYMAKGRCKFHYGEHKRRARGVPKRHIPHPDNNESWFLARVDRAGECWEWSGSRMSAGYGTLSKQTNGGYGGSSRTPGVSHMLAHRAAYEMWVGPLVAGSVVHHKCANRLCVRPDHLQLIDNVSNTAEMHGRAAYERRITSLEKENLLLKQLLMAAAA